MFHMPMSSPMMATMFGRCPAGAGDGVGCCACAELVSPTAESAEAATRELPLSKRSRRFIPPPDCGVASWESPGGSLLLMTYSSRCYAIGSVRLTHRKPAWLVEVVTGPTRPLGSLARYSVGGRSDAERPLTSYLSA